MKTNGIARAAIALLVATIAVVSLSACSDKASEESSARQSSAGQPSQAQQTGSPATQAGNEKTPASADALVTAAKAEGQVVLYDTAAEDQIAALADAFQSKYGIKVIFIAPGSGEVVQKIQAEKASGNIQADVFKIVSPNSVWEKLGKDGLIANISVPNAGNIIPALKDDLGLAEWPVSFYLCGIMYNSARIPADKLPKTWKDLTGEKFRNSDLKLGITDPNPSGVALDMMASLTELYGEGFFEALAAQKPFVTNTTRGFVEFTLTGEVDLGMPGLEPFVIGAQKKGDPLAMVYPEDGVTVSVARIAAVKGGPHPNAAELLVRFYLSEEWQDAMSQKFGFRSVLETVAPPKGAPESSKIKILKPPTITDPDVFRKSFTKAFGVRPKAQK